MRLLILITLMAMITGCSSAPYYSEREMQAEMIRIAKELKELKAEKRKREKIEALAQFREDLEALKGGE